MNKYINKENVTLLKQAINYIESKYDITDIEYIKNYPSDRYFYNINFKLKTKYYNVPMRLLISMDFGGEINLSISFINVCHSRKSAGGYCKSIYNKCGINFNYIDNEFNLILKNIKEDATWCDQSKYDF